MDALLDFRLVNKGRGSAEVRTLIRESISFRRQLEELYERYFHRRMNKGCTSCWLDAYALLMRYDIQKLSAMVDRKFELKAGALLIDVKEGRNDLMATHHNLTDELALYHLRTNPKCIRHFSKYPENWEALAQAEAETEASKPAEETKARRSKSKK